MENLISETNGAKYCDGKDGERICTGAMDGRYSTWRNSADVDVTKPIHITQVALYDDYDKGGAYWGQVRGNYVYEAHATDVDGNDIYRFARDSSAFEAVSRLIEEAGEPVCVLVHCSRVKGISPTDINKTQLKDIGGNFTTEQCLYFLDALGHAVTAFLWTREDQWTEQRDAVIEEKGEDLHLPSDMELDVKWQELLLKLVVDAETFRLSLEKVQEEGSSFDTAQLPAPTLGHEIGMMAAGTGDGMRLKGWPRAFAEKQHAIHWEFEKAETYDEGLIR